MFIYFHILLSFFFIFSFNFTNIYYFNNATMCVICNGTWLQTTEPNCAGCTNVTEAPDHPNATTVYLHGCVNLIKIGNLPLATTLYCHGCELLTEIGNASNLTTLMCHGCPLLAAVSVYDNLTVSNGYPPRGVTPA